MEIYLFWMHRWLIMAILSSVAKAIIFEVLLYEFMMQY